MRVLLVAAAALSATPTASAEPVVVQVRPSAIDPAVKAFDDPSTIVIPDRATAATPVALFLTGTGGRSGGPAPFLKVIAGQGYRVIGLQYDDEPAVGQKCQSDPDPECAAGFRRMRTYGDGPYRGVVNPVAESIDARFAALLRHLATTRPGEGWGAFLAGEHPDWSRILVSGLSQGAGMAAFIAKQHAVPRVVLFSSPWDWTGPQRTPAPWLSWASATPVDRWYAAYHKRELTVPLIRRAYAKLAIPGDHIHVLDGDIPPQFARMEQNSPNPYHTATIRDPRFLTDWRAMFGRGDPPS